MNRFPPQTRIIIDVVFPDEFRIGWEYQGKKFIPGMGSYYTFITAIEFAWNAFMDEFPNLSPQKTCGHLTDEFSYICAFCHAVVSATSNGYYPDGEPVGEV
jgi:hypothetical protein